MKRTWNRRALTLELSLLVGMALTVLCALAHFDADCHTIEQSVVRLHVIAHSDSAEDQALKLTVRDAVLKAGGEAFSSNATKEDALQTLSRLLPRLQQTAEAVVRSAGHTEPVTVKIGKSSFPTRTYGSVTLPAGTYDAVRVVIGNGEGKNWWCVMFPPLCLPAAEGPGAASDVLNPSALHTAEQDPRFEMRFWIVEKLRQWGL